MLHSISLITVFAPAGRRVLAFFALVLLLPKDSQDAAIKSWFHLIDSQVSLC